MRRGLWRTEKKHLLSNVYIDKLSHVSSYVVQKCFYSCLKNRIKLEKKCFRFVFIPLVFLCLRLVSAFILVLIFICFSCRSTQHLRAAVVWAYDVAPFHFKSLSFIKNQLVPDFNKDRLVCSGHLHRSWCPSAEFSPSLVTATFVVTWRPWTLPPTVAWRLLRSSTMWVSPSSRLCRLSSPSPTSALLHRSPTFSFPVVTVVPSLQPSILFSQAFTLRSLLSASQDLAFRSLNLFGSWWPF